MNFTIKNKLIMGFGGIVLLALIIATIGYINLSNQNARFTNTVDGTVKRLKLSLSLRQQATAISRGLKNVIIEKETTSKKAEVERLRAMIEDFNQDLPLKERTWPQLLN